MADAQDKAGSGHCPSVPDHKAAEKLFAGQWHFVRGVPSLEFLPASDRPEIAFAGRSNVGKSSLINGLTNRRNLARTSNTPGRTQELNFFQPDNGSFYLVDMPGYGYARAPKAKVEAWTRLIRDYLRGRPVLRRVYILVDSRHGLKDVDTLILDLLDEAAVPYQLILTKMDKLKVGEVEKALHATQDAVATRAAAFPFALATSSEEKQGMAELKVSILGAVS
ncbi:MAG: ribosome biogenesis GTP-binding protein YihA/YsxC, partial [Pseudomonadota bacterium]